VAGRPDLRLPGMQPTVNVHHLHALAVAAALLAAAVAACGPGSTEVNGADLHALWQPRY